MKLKLNIADLDFSKFKNFKKEDLLKNKILLIGVAMGFFSIWYAYNRIYVPTKNLMGKVEMDLFREGANTDISKRLALLRGQVGSYKRMFARGADIPWLVDRISSAGIASGLNIESLDSKPLVRGKQFLYSRAELTAAGTFHQLGDFISKLENSREFVKVEKLVFKKDKDLIKAEIVISSYFVK